MSPSTSLLQYTLHLADDALILGHRNSEWTGYGPVLEQDIAISNIALDLIGQARNFYQYASGLINQGDAGARAGSRAAEVTEDSLAYLRDAWDFKNCLLAEQDNGDWAKTILRQFFFSAWQFYLYGELQQCENSELAAVGEKALKETTYHLRWSSEWMIRLGDGTEESHARMLKAIDELWSYTGELFDAVNYELQAVEEGIGIDAGSLKEGWLKKIKETFEEATLIIPASTFQHTGGKNGVHSEHLGFIL